MSDKRKCIHCGGEFELIPGKPGLANECPKHPYGSTPTPPQKPSRVVFVPDKVQAAAYARKDKQQDARLAERTKRDKDWARRNQSYRR